MQITLDSGVSLAFDEAGAGSRTLLLTHGLGCDRSSMGGQVEHFQDRYRVVNVDLRGHGESSKPEGSYHPDVFAADLAELCRRLNLERPFLIGHSLGGVIGLRLAYLEPELLSGLIALDAAIAVSPQVEQLTPGIVQGLDALEGDDYRSAVIEVLGGFFGPHDDPHRREVIIKTMSSCRKDVFLSGWLETVMDTDCLAPLASLTVPMLYIAAESANGGLEQIRAGQGVAVAQTVGTGHFLPVECPEQVNPMIERFLRINTFS